MAATKKRGQSKISPIEVSTLSGEPRPQAGAAVAGWTEEEIMDGVGVAGLEVAAVL